MKATRNGQVVDGQVYEQGDEIWDLGLWRHNSPNESKYDYTGIEDVAKLPPYAVSGATAFNPQTGKAYCAAVDPSNTTRVVWSEI